MKQDQSLKSPFINSALSEAKQNDAVIGIKPLHVLSWVPLFLLLLAYPLSLLLPRSLAWENGFIEDLQAIVLFGGFLVAFYCAFRSSETPHRQLWLSVSPYWLIIMLRELDWGAAFYPPIAMGPNGPKLAHLGDLWFGPYVYPLLTLFLGWGLYLFFKNRLYRLLFQEIRLKRFPTVEVTVAFIAIIISTLAEHKGYALLGNRHQLLEELTEFTFYVGMLIAQIKLFLSLKRATS